MGEKFQRWSFKDKRADGETEKEEREENRTNERDEREISGEKGVKYCFFFFFAILWIVQFYVYNCTVAVLQKNLQYCCLQFLDARVFEA